MLNFHHNRECRSITISDGNKVYDDCFHVLFDVIQRLSVQIKWNNHNSCEIGRKIKCISYAVKQAGEDHVSGFAR